MKMSLALIIQQILSRDLHGDRGIHLVIPETPIIVIYLIITRILWNEIMTTQQVKCSVNGDFLDKNNNNTIHLIKQNTISRLFWHLMLVKLLSILQFCCVLFRGNNQILKFRNDQTESVRIFTEKNLLSKLLCCTRLSF